MIGFSRGHVFVFFFKQQMYVISGSRYTVLKEIIQKTKEEMFSICSFGELLYMYIDTKKEK